MATDPTTLVKDTKLIAAMTRMTNRVGIVACLNQSAERSGPFLFANAIPEDVRKRFVGTGDLSFSSFIDTIGPSICEVLTDSMDGHWYKKPQVPKPEATESGYVLDANSPFMELGRGDVKADSLTNGEEVLASVRSSLTDLVLFNNRSNDLLNVFAATLHQLSTIEFPAVERPFSGFAYGVALPARFVEPFVNFLFHRGTTAADFDVSAIWPTAGKTRAVSDVWRRFVSDAKCRDVFSRVVAAFKACLASKEDITNPLHKKVKVAFSAAVDPKSNQAWYDDRARLKEIPKAYLKAFKAYHSVGQVIRSKVLMMSIANSVVKSYFGEQDPDDDAIEELFGKMRDANGFPAPVRRMPEAHRRRLKQAMTEHLEFLLQEIQMTSTKERDANAPTSNSVYNSIATRLKPEAEKLLDEIADDVLGDNRILTTAERAKLAKVGIKLKPEELKQIQLLRESGMVLPDVASDEGLKALIILRAVTRMAVPLQGQLKTFQKMFESGDPAFRGFVRATQNLVRDVVAPILFAAPGLTPEQMIALFKEAVNSSYVGAILLDDASLAPVLDLANKYQQKISARLKDVTQGGRKISVLERGAGIQTVTEFLPALLNAVLDGAGDKLTAGLENLNLLLGDFVRRIRNAAAERKAGLGTLFSLKKGTLPTGKSKKGKEQETTKKAAATTASKTESVMQSELENIAEFVVEKKRPQAAAMERELKQAEKLATLAQKTLAKSGPPDWSKASEALGKDRDGSQASQKQQFHAIKLAWYSQLAESAYVAESKACNGFEGWEYERILRQIVRGAEDPDDPTVLGGAFKQANADWEGKTASLEAAAADADATVTAELEKDPLDQKKLDAAFDRQAEARNSLDLHLTHARPDEDLLRQAVQNLKKMVEIRPAASEVEPGFEAFLQGQLNVANDQPAKLPKKSAATSTESQMNQAVEAAARLANGLDDTFSEIYSKYDKNQDKLSFAHDVEYLELLKQMLISERDLDLGRDMSEYYQLLLDLVRQPDLNEFRKQNPLTKYFDLQTHNDLKRLRNVLTGAARDAMTGIQSFVSELLGFEHLFAAAAKNKDAGVEIVVWNMTSDQFLSELNLAGRRPGDLATSFQPSLLTDPGFNLPLVLYVTDSAFAYDQGKIPEFVTQLSGKLLRYKQRAMVLPPVVVSFSGISFEQRKGKPQKIVFDVLEDFDPISVDELPFAFYYVGPSRPKSTQESFLTCVPAGYELLGCLLGDLAEYPLDEDKVDINSPDIEYLRLLRQGDNSLVDSFKQMLFPTDGNSLWVDMFLTSLSTVGVYLSRTALAAHRSDFDIPVLQDWFDLWIKKGRDVRAEVKQRHLLENTIWKRVLPPRVSSIRAMFRDVELVPTGTDEAPGPQLPPASLLEVNVPVSEADVKYDAKWFNILWQRLGPINDEGPNEPEGDD